MQRNATRVRLVGSGLATLRVGSWFGATTLAVAATAAQTPSLTLVESVESGAWMLRKSVTDTAPACFNDFAQLLQPRHSRAMGCDRFVITNTANELTVNYTCAGVGHGRTTLRRETNRVVQVDSQGIDGRSPFAIQGEARRVASCPKPPAIASSLVRRQR